MQVDPEPSTSQAGPSTEIIKTDGEEEARVEEEEIKSEVKDEEKVEEDVEMEEGLPEGASEVLYINNLNEKIDLVGTVLSSRINFKHEKLTVDSGTRSDEAVVEDVVQAVRGSPRCYSSSQCKDERSGFRQFRFKGGCRQSSERSQGVPSVRQTNGKTVAGQLDLIKQR